ncbi:MAG: hypothetical protein ACRCY8_06670 [Dermatophilaceae bacterium]
MDAQEFVLSLSGFDEIAIEKAFGSDLEGLTGQKTMRALSFVKHRRDGKSDVEAYEACMSESQKAILDAFGVEVAGVESPTKG